MNSVKRLFSYDKIQQATKSNYTKDTTSESNVNYSVKRLFSYNKIQQATKSNYTANSKARGSERTMVVIMSVMWYYHSVREELSLIAEDALTLLDQQDYIGVFKSFREFRKYCNYQ